MDWLRKCGSVRVSLTIEGKGLFSTEHTLAQCACTRAGHDPVWFENMHALKCAGSPLLVRCRPVQAECCTGGCVCVCEFPDFLLNNYSRCEGGETS